MKTRLTCAVLLLGIGPAGAETLYNQDGVRLSATVQEIDPGAATCRIREARHSAEEYARLKPNDGQPLDVWRIEVLVANYSGKPLDYLNAHLNVESSWPPCDNWDGPETHYGAPVVWTGPLMSIQDVGTVAPGEEVRETAFVLAYHEEEPSLGRWDIDYDFVGGTGAERDVPPAERTARIATSDTPLEHSTASFEPDETCAGKEIGASCWMELANQPGCYLWNAYLNEYETATWTGACSRGLASGTGEETSIDTGISGFARFTGTGELRGGKRNGRWVLRSAREGDDSNVSSEGTYVAGKRQGRWTRRAVFPWATDWGRTGLEITDEGTYLDDKRHGYWVYRRVGTDAEASQEGAYVNGRRHGHWIERSDGDVDQGAHVHDKRHGHWTMSIVGTNPEGTRLGEIGGVIEGPYVAGSRHGRWTTRFATGSVMYTCYSNDEEVDC